MVGNLNDVSQAYLPPEDWSPLPKRKYGLYNALESTVYDKEQISLPTTADSQLKNYFVIGAGLKVKREEILVQGLFLGPTFLIYTAFVILPIFLAIYYSLTWWDGMTPPIFVGLENFKELLTTSDYWVVLKNELILIGIALIIQIPVALILAYLIYRTTRGFTFFRFTYFFPVVISQVVIALMFTMFFNSDIGPINKSFNRMGLHWMEKTWLADPRIVLYSVMTPMIWQYIGFYVVIFLAALQSVPEEIFESAIIDGASPFQIFVKLVVPLLREFEIISAVFLVTGALKAFEHSYVMTWGGPGFRSSFLTVYMYRVAFHDGFLGLGSAIGVNILALALVFIVIFRKIFSRERIY